MTAMFRRVGLSILSLLLAVAGARAEEVLQAPGSERIKVERTQFEVIVWPPKDNVDSCRSLTNADFDVVLDRQPFFDFILDPLEPAPQTTSEAATSPAPEPATPSRLVALLFDWWGISPQGDTTYGAIYRAFRQAHAYIEEHPSDRFVILGLGDEADFLTAKFKPGPEALATLDRFEADTFAKGFLLHGPHVDARDWRNAILETVSRLGAMEPHETKDLFVLTTDVRYYYSRDLFEHDLRTLTTQNRVRVHSIDLAWDERVLPYGLFALSEAGGGIVFGNSATLTSAIQTLDRLRPCTFRITLKVPESKRALPLSVTMKDPRVRVTAPEAVGGSMDFFAAEKAELKNDFEEPTDELGVRITPQLVRVSRGELSSDYTLTVLVEKNGDFDPEDVGTLRVYGAVWNQQKPKKAMYADFSAFRITEDGVRKIAGSESEVFRFPETVKIPNSENSVSIIVSVHGPRESLARVSASRRIEMPLPE